MEKHRLSGLQGFLMGGNTPVAQIRDGEISRILEPALLPFHFLYAEDPSLHSWLRHRCLDTGRTNARFLLRELDLEQADPIQIVLSVNGAAITDHFWIQDSGCPGTYEQIRFHQDLLAKTALLGSSAGITLPAGYRCAELTNTGRFEKCWHLENGRWWLYKCGFPEHTFSELAVQAMGNYLGLAMASYELADRAEISAVLDCRAPASLSAVKTPDFTSGTLNFEPAAGLGCRKGDAVKNEQLLRRLSPAIADSYRRMVLLDALVFNTDRHPYNFGVLRDQATGLPLALAPIFDHNLSLSAALADYDRFAAGETDSLYLDWCRLADSQPESIASMELPVINRQVIESLLTPSMFRVSRRRKNRGSSGFWQPDGKNSGNRSLSTAQIRSTNKSRGEACLLCFFCYTA